MPLYTVHDLPHRAQVMTKMQYKNGLPAAIGNSALFFADGISMFSLLNFTLQTANSIELTETPGCISEYLPPNDN